MGFDINDIIFKEKVCDFGGFQRNQFIFMIGNDSFLYIF